MSTRLSTTPHHDVTTSAVYIPLFGDGNSPSLPVFKTATPATVERTENAADPGPRQHVRVSARRLGLPQGHGRTRILCARRGWKTLSSRPPGRSTFSAGRTTTVRIKSTRALTLLLRLPYSYSTFGCSWWRFHCCCCLHRDYTRVPSGTQRSFTRQRLHP